MFTGIITDIAEITHISPLQGSQKDDSQKSDTQITLKTHYDVSDIAIGASIACHGICLTVTEKTPHHLTFSLSNETLSKTSAQYWQIGQRINLERALCMGDELGGHLVTGHVDALGHIEDIISDAASLDIKIAAPKHLMGFIAPKGSVCCDGISLTVNKVYDQFFHVNIIPHTQQATSWHSLKKGDYVNLEIDMMARYVVRYMETLKDKKVYEA